jgi:hypothetical protein
VLARRSDVVAGRELLDDFYIRNEAGAREDSFEKIVAEKRVLGYTACKRGFEGIHVVDALAGIRAFPHEILVHIGNGRGIRIDAART